MKFGSLFSGIGGFDLGFERAGMECAWQVEFDAAASGVLAEHWPNLKNIGDVRNAGKANLEPVELICGGFPCQDLSVAGKRKGLAGERSGLWFEFYRILAELKPAWVVIENVPGLLSSDGGRDFAVVLRGLVELGYGVCWRVLDSQYFGLAQRRKRVFIVGHLGDGRAAEVLFEPEGGIRDTPPGREAREGIAATLTGGSGKRGWEDPSDGNVGRLVAYNERVITSPGNRSEVKGDVSPTINGEGLMSVAFTLPASSRGTGDGHGNAWNSNYVTAPLKAEDPGRRNGGSSPIAEEFVIAAPLTARHSGESGKWPPINEADNLISMALNARGGSGRLDAESETLIASPLGGHHTRRDLDNETYVSRPLAASTTTNHMDESQQTYPGGVRRLTPTECERLQGFPDGWTAGQSDSARYRQLGNAVSVPAIEWIGRRIMNSK